MASSSTAIPAHAANRGRRFRLPGSEPVIVAYTFVLVVMGTLLVIFPNKLDSIWPLFMVPILVAAVYYRRRVFTVMLASYASISAWVIGVSSQDKLASL